MCQIGPAKIRGKEGIASAAAGKAQIFHRLICSEFPISTTRPLKVLDFGCGDGATVQGLLDLGYDAYGCDIGADWPADSGEFVRLLPATTWSGSLVDRLHPIRARPYELPFEDGSFDVCISAHVFEHAANKREALAEICRVLKPDGLGVHIMPPKWSIIEPHIYVPLASWFWPHVPSWWIAFWALVGVRNEHQRGLNWRQVARLNSDYCRDGLHYWRRKEFRRLFEELFGDFRGLEKVRLERGQGRVARLLRMLPWGASIAYLAGVFHESTIGHRKRKPYRQ